MTIRRHHLPIYVYILCYKVLIVIIGIVCLVGFLFGEYKYKHLRIHKTLFNLIKSASSHNSVGFLKAFVVKKFKTWTKYYFLKYWGG